MCNYTSSLARLVAGANCVTLKDTEERKKLIRCVKLLDTEERMVTNNGKTEKRRVFGGDQEAVS